MLAEKWYGAGMELIEGDFHQLIRQPLLSFISPADGTLPNIPYASDFANNSTTQLFSFKFVTSSALACHHSHLFSLLKQHLMLGRQQLSSLTPDHLSHCHSFLCYLSYSLASRSLQPESRAELQLMAEAVFPQLEAIFLLCGSVGEIFRSNGLLASSSRPLSHAPLDICPLACLLTDTKTHIALAAHLLALLVPELQSRALQLVRSVWTELLELSVSLFLSQSDLLRLNFSPFPCRSLLELWCLSAGLSERMLTLDNPGYWDSFIPFLLSCASTDATSAEPLSSPSLRHQFFWWMLLGLSRVISPSIQTNRCWGLCKEAISSLMTHHATISPSALVFSLWALIRLSQVWGPSMESVMLLWEGISKKMCESSQKEVSITDVSDLRYDIISTPQDVHTPLLLSPFELFLRFFSLQFALMDQTPSESWQPYKGRFYSKLSARRLQNSHSNGILNLYLLAFVLSYKSDVNDVIDKTSEILIRLLSPAAVLSPRNKLLVWECLCGLLYVFVERRVSAGSFLSRILPSLAEYHHAAMFDRSCARREWEVCDLFWRQLPDLSCCLEQIEIVSAALRELYSAYYTAFHAEHLSNIMKNLNQLLSGAYSLVTENAPAKPACRDICSFLWGFGYSAWKQDSGCQEMGSLVGGLFLLSLVSECELQLTLGQVVKQVLFSETFSCPVGSNFIRTLLSDGAGRHYISQNQMVSQLIIKAWLLYIIQAFRYPQYVPHVVSCTRELGALQPLEGIDTRRAISLSEVLEVLESFMQRLQTNSLSPETAQFYFSDFLEWMEPLLCDENTTKECLLAIYQIASSLVRYGSSLIYSRTQPHCVLPRLIEYLFLPSHSLAKPPHPSHLECVRRHICHFLSSLRRLQPESDPFIQRKIRQLLSQYFPRFSQQAAEGAQSCAIFTHKPNPFLSLFEDCGGSEEGSNAGMEEGLYFLSLIRELFLKLPQQPTSLLPTLLFLQTVVTSSGLEFSASASEHLSFPMLGCLLACDVCPSEREPPRIRELAQSVARRMVTAVSSSKGDCTSYHKQKLIECIKKFVEVNLPTCHGKVFTTLKFVVPLFPEAITLSLDHFHASLLELERENPKLASGIGGELRRLESLLAMDNRFH